MPSAFALAAGEYVAAVWPAVGPRAAALVLLVAATAVTVAGIWFNAAVTAALLTLELATILVVSALGLAHADWSVGTLLDPRVFRADGSTAPTTLWTLLAGVALGMGAYAGYGGAVVFSEETRGPRRGIARAVLRVLGVAVAAELLAITALLQTGRDLAIVAGILAAGVLYDLVHLRPRRGTHWVLLDPVVGERDVSDRGRPARHGSRPPR